MRSKKNNIHKKQNNSQKKQLGGAGMDGSINPNLSLFMAEIRKLNEELGQLPRDAPIEKRESLENTKNF